MPSNPKIIIRLSPFLFTCLNGLAGLLGIFVVINGEVFWPLRLIIIGAGFDFLDGYIAKKNRQESRIGAYMDSFADEITYVLLPSFWLIFMHQDKQSDIILELSTIMISLFYLSCGSFRLIRFLKNPTENYFEGLPASVAALVVGSLIVLILASPPEFAFLFNIGVHSIFFLISISLLMITHMKYPSHRSYSHFYNAFRMVGYLLIGVYVIFPNFWISMGIFLFFVAYTLTGPYFTSKQ